MAMEEVVPTNVLIRAISSFFLRCLAALFCFSIHLLSSRLHAQKPGEKKKNKSKQEGGLTSYPGSLSHE